MRSVIGKLPVGWCLIEDEGAWKVFDGEGELICEAKNTDSLHQFLTVELNAAQHYAAFMMAMNQPEAAEA
tara:strand:+ start:476 stop:685 length:210 start_codon:yes stop_codon:yes gene_type:complete